MPTYEGWNFEIPSEWLEGEINYATNEDRAQYGEHVVVAYVNPAMGIDNDVEPVKYIIRDYRDAPDLIENLKDGAGSVFGLLTILFFVGLVVLTCIGLFYLLDPRTTLCFPLPCN